MGMHTPEEVEHKQPDGAVSPSGAIPVLAEADSILGLVNDKPQLVALLS